MWCNLVGIKPIGDRTRWTEEEIDEIYDKIDLEYGDYLYHHTIAVDESVESPVNINRHDIVLLAVCDDEQFSVNDLLVKLNLAEYNPATKHHLQNVPNLLENYDSDSSDSDWDKEIDVNRMNEWPRAQGETSTPADGNDDLENLEDAYVCFNDDELRELFQTSTRNSSALEKIDETNETEVDSNQNNDLATTQPVDNGYISAEIDGSDASTEHLVHHQVEYICKRPKVSWWQTEDVLVLRISAHDNVQYGLEITPEQLAYE